MWDQVGRLSAHHRNVPAEVRLLKLTEEVGEVAEAFIGMRGLNRRKGICRTRDDLLAELADVIITAAVAMSGVTGDVDGARSHLGGAWPRLPSGPGSDGRHTPQGVRACPNRGMGKRHSAAAITVN